MLFFRALLLLCILPATLPSEAPSFRSASGIGRTHRGVTQNPNDRTIDGQPASSIVWYELTDDDIRVIDGANPRFHGLHKECGGTMKTRHLSGLAAECPEMISSGPGATFHGVSVKCKTHLRKQAFTCNCNLDQHIVQLVDCPNKNSHAGNRGPNPRTSNMADSL